MTILSMLCWGASRSRRKCSDSSSRARAPEPPSVAAASSLSASARGTPGGSAAAATKALSSWDSLSQSLSVLTPGKSVACSLEELGELAVAAVRCCAMSSPSM